MGPYKSIGPFRGPLSTLPLCHTCHNPAHPLLCSPHAASNHISMTDGCGKYYRTAKTPSARKNKQKVTKMSHCAKFLQSRVRKLQKDPRYCVRPESSTVTVPVTCMLCTIMLQLPVLYNYLGYFLGSLLYFKPLI